MKNQALFSSKDKSKKSKCRLLQFLFGALRVKNPVNFTVKDQEQVTGCQALYCKKYGENCNVLEGQ